MIVIATNNGKQYLSELLTDFENIGVNDEIAIVDTQSNDENSLNFLEELNKNNPYKLNVTIHQTPYRGFDTGAYIYAINNFSSDRFYFMQDSIRIKTIEYFNEIDKKLIEGTVVCLLRFDPNLFDSNDQINFCNSNFGSIDYDNGIFGPIFSITKNDIEKIDKKYLIYPTNKMEQMAMERGWSILFKRYGINVESIQGNWNPNKLSNDEYSLFTKKFPYRM
jgi:hypothetical protein